MHGFSASSRVIRPLVVYGSKGTSHSPREKPLSNPEEESKNVLAGVVSFSELIQNFDSFGRQEEQGKGHRTSRMKSFTQSMTLPSRPSSLPSIERTCQ